MPRETLIQVRRGLAYDWTNQNPILAEGELGFEVDTNKIKIGNGTTNWGSLDYISASSNSIKVKNNTGYAINKGQAVYIFGYDTNDSIPTINLYIANNTINEKKFIGLASAYIPDGGIGLVTIFGIFNSINTTGNISNIALGNESWSNGDILYVSPYDYGKLTKVKPQYNIVIAGIILNSHENGSILVKSLINSRLDELNGISILNLTNNDLLKYSSSSSSWTNSNQIDCGNI